MNNKKFKKNKVNKFFSDNSNLWILNGYNSDGYNYPVAAKRLNIVKKVIKKIFNKKKLKILDIGCGGGQVSLELAKAGHVVSGIDQSDVMIETSIKNREKLEAKLKKNVNFYQGDVDKNHLKNDEFDVCIALGLIGYLEKEENLFKLAKKILKPNGIFIVSTRNKLFNMQSLSFRTNKEISEKNSEKLIKEIYELYDDIPSNISNQIIVKFRKTLNKIKLSNKKNTKFAKLSPAEKKVGRKNYRPFFEPKQHTPKELIRYGNRYSFINIGNHGVHPHLIDPNLNKLFPPQVFNSLSECLEPLEDHPASLVISSVIMGVFKKK